MADVLGNESTGETAEEARAVGGPVSARAARRVEALLGVRRYALVIGIDAYAPEIGALAGAVADARAVACVLGDASRRDHYDPVTLLVDHEATRAGIAHAFATLKAQLDASPGASAVIYFAGHGVATALPEEAETDTPGYLLPCDARRDDVTSFVSMRTLRDWIDALASHHLLLVLDCCFAGAFRWAGTRALRTTPRQLYHERLERYLRDPAWQVLTSAAHDERALDVMQTRMTLGGRAPLTEDNASGARSPFAVAFVECLRGDADFASAVMKRPDGVITSGELHTYLEHRFSAWEVAGHRVQKPLLFPWPGKRDHKGEFVFLNPREALRLESAGELLEANNPYCGLRPFRYDARDAGLFFGREVLVARLVEQVVCEPVVVVLGASGTGKSSLVAAGLLPKLAADGWAPVCDPVRPGSEASEALRRLARALDATAEDAMLVEAARRFFARHRDARRVIVIDQLEELVTLRQGNDLRAEFFAALDGAVEASEGRLRVVYTLRSDFEPHFAEGLIARHPTGRFRVTPMSRDELREVIEKPAEACVLGFDPPALVEVILDEVIDAPGVLPLLSFTLSEMYRNYVRAYRAGSRDDRALTQEDYERLGRVEGALSRRAEEVYARFDASARVSMRRVMLRMLSVEGGQPTRRPARLNELTYGPEEDARVRSVLGELTEARLVVGTVDEHGAEIVELAHDKIALGWPRLTEWIHEPGERERLDALRVVRERAEDWRRFGRTGGWLDRDTRLDRWAELAAGEESPFNAEEQALLRGSLQRRDEEREAEKRRIAALEDALSRARDHARMSALQVMEHDPTAQVALLREVERPERVLQWEEAARRLLACPGVAPLVIELPDATKVWWCSPRGTYITFGGLLTVSVMRRTDGTGEPLDLREDQQDAYGPVFSPDETHVLTMAQQDSTVRVRRADGTGGAVVLGTGDSGFFPRFSPDGTRVLIVSFRGTVYVVRTDGTGDPVVLRSHGSRPRAEFSPEGERVLTWFGEHGSAYVCRADGTGEPIALEGRKGGVDSAEFSPDGTRVLLRGVFGWGRVWRADGTGKPLDVPGEVSFPGDGETVTSSTFSRDGARVLTLFKDGTGRVDRVDGNGEPVFLKVPKTGFSDVAVAEGAFSPDGTRVLIRFIGNKSARVWRTDRAGEPLVLRSHDEAVTYAEFSPDGEHVLTSSEDGAVRVWRADGTGEPFVLRGHDKTVYSASFSQDGTRVLSRSEDGTARVWQADGAGEPLVMRGNRSSARFLSGGQCVIGESGDRTVRVWKTSGTSEPLVLRGPDKQVISATLSRDGTNVLACFQLHNEVHLWRIEGPDRHVVLRCHDDNITSAKFSPNGAHFLTTSRDGTARVWRTDGAGEPVILRGREENWTSAEFSPDGAHVLTKTLGGPARVWRADGTGEPVVLGDPDKGTHAGQFSSDGVHVLTRSEDGVVRVWRADGTGESIVLKGPRGVTSVVFSPDGARVLIAYDDGTTRVWRTDGACEPVVLQEPEENFTAAWFSRHAANVFTRTLGGPSISWSASGTDDLVALGIPDDGRFSPDDACVLGWNGDGTARIRRADGTGKSVVLRGVRRSLSAEFSPDGVHVLTMSGEGVVRVWRADGTGEPVVLRGCWRNREPGRISPDGRYVFGESDRQGVGIWRADGTGEPVALPFPQQPGSVAFSPDGLHVLGVCSVLGEQSVYVCRVDGAGEPVVLRAPGVATNSFSRNTAAFSPDGARVLTTHADGTVRVWRWSRWRSISEMLWGATPYCLSIKKRMELLGETEEEATRADQAARQKIAALAAKNASSVR